MNNIDKYKELFQKVEDGLPQKQGSYIVLCSNNTDSWPAIEMFIIKDQNKYWYDYLNITHWLRMDRLTTKEMAIEFAENAYDSGWGLGKYGDPDIEMSKKRVEIISNGTKNL